MSKSRGARRGRSRGAKPAGKPRAPIWQRKSCGACGQPVRLAEEDTGGGRLRAALLEANPDPRGVLIRQEDGTLLRDPGKLLPGERWLWHHCPVRNTPSPRSAPEVPHG